MAEEQVRLAKLIMKEHFGDDVLAVVSYMFKRGSCTLRDICAHSQLNKGKVKQIVRNLVNHKMIKPNTVVEDAVLYTPDMDNILVRVRYAKFIHSVKDSNEDDIPELIVETLLLNGCGTKKKIVEKMSERYNDTDGNGKGRVDQKAFEECFKRLESNRLIEKVETQFNDDCLQGVTTNNGGKRKNTAQSDAQPPEKRSRLSSSAVETALQDDSAYYCANIDRFHQLILNENISSIAKEKIDVAAAKIIETMISLSAAHERTSNSEFTHSVSLFEIISKLPKVPKLSKQEVENYLSLLMDKKRCGIITKTDESGGGMYCIDLKRCATTLCLATIESIVQERLGSKACRVFRLLVQKKNLEQKQVGELAMIPFKEVKELLYKLFEERLVKIQELTRTGDFAPSRTFYLFSVDVPQVSRLMLAKSYQALGNLMSRRESEVRDNKRLLEKNEKIESILATLAENGDDTEAAVQELDELITPSEKHQLEKLKNDLTRLEQGELRVDSTIFLLQSYLLFH